MIGRLVGRSVLRAYRLIDTGVFLLQAIAARAAAEKKVRAELKDLKRLRDAGVESWKEVRVHESQ